MNKSLEIIKPLQRTRNRVKAAIFDFDGTISTLRQGWESVMEPLMIEMINGSDHADPELVNRIRAYIDESTGIQTIFQMEWLAIQVSQYKRNPEVHDPWWYKDEYNRRLLEMIKTRTDKLLSGELKPDDFLIKGSYEFISALFQKGIEIYIVSGTDDSDVRKEVEALGITKFVKQVSGAPFRKAKCSKDKVIKDLIGVRGLHGSELLIIGDGRVEVALGAQAGAVTIGAATDEIRRSGINDSKRTRLIRAGANAIVGDFLGYKEIFRWLAI